MIRRTEAWGGAQGGKSCSSRMFRWRSKREGELRCTLRERSKRRSRPRAHGGIARRTKPEREYEFRPFCILYLTDQAVRPFEVGLAVAVRQEPVRADAHEPLWRNVSQ